METFIEPPHTEVSLRASNWRLVGETGGRGRQDRNHAAAETRKAIYLYELEPDWRARLGVGPAPARGDTPLEPAEGLDAQHWAEYEFGGAPLGDKRLTKRLVDSAQRQGEDPLRAFTAVARDDWAAVKGYYRLIDQSGGLRGDGRAYPGAAPGAYAAPDAGASDNSHWLSYFKVQAMNTIQIDCAASQP